MISGNDPRRKTAKRAFAFSWIYYTVFVVAVMASAFLLGVKPYIWGMPRWAAVALVIVPAGFVALLVVLVEYLIPDVPLAKDETKERPE